MSSYVKIFFIALVVQCFYCKSDVTKQPLKVDKVVVYKAERKMMLLYKGNVVREYRVALGGNPEGHKLQEGDQKTPEGEYIIDWHNPHSSYHKSLHISYPNKADKLQARRRKVSPGGNVFIHGLGNGWGEIGKEHALNDWTLGCIAVSNEEMDEIFEAVKNGTKIFIYPNKPQTQE